MVSKEEKKLNRVISFLTKGLTGLADELESTVKNINEFKDSLQKAQKDLKTVEVEEEEEVTTVSTSSQKVVAANPGTAKSAAANTLFNLLSGTVGGAKSASIPPLTASAGGTSSKSPVTRPPSAPSAGVPPKAPSAAPVAGPPSAPGGPPKRGANLPPAPKLPPAPGTGAPPQAPPGVKAPAFVKRPEQPIPSKTGGVEEGTEASISSAIPSAPPVAPIAAKAGGGLGSLRDEMLDELNRLKKIMRGE